MITVRLTKEQIQLIGTCITEMIDYWDDQIKAGTAIGISQEQKLRYEKLIDHLDEEINKNVTK